MKPYVMNNPMKLWYRVPADSWEKALPLGNGRLGAMVFGGTDTEVFQLNEDTLWSGFPKEFYNQNAIQSLPKVRELIFEGKCRDAQALIETNMLGTWNQSYLPLANLIFKFNEPGGVTEYQRELDLHTAIAGTAYRRGPARWLREAFISAVDQVLIYRISSDLPGQVNVAVSLDCLHPFTVHPHGSQSLFLNGQCPVNVAPHYLESDQPVVYCDENGNRGMKFGVYLMGIPEGGSIKISDGSLSVTGADALTLFVAAATSFNGFDMNPITEGKDYETLCFNWVNNAVRKDYYQLRQDHIQDYTALFSRLDIRLGESDRSGIPTDERLTAVRNGAEDPQLAALLFQYGRYLLIASSRPGTQPANLQGIWNKELRPYWSCNWTTNINAQMNYWLAEVGNLAECHEPLFDLIEELSISGRKTAVLHYGCQGWTAHHNVDIWRGAIPAGGWPNFNWAGCSFWPLSGAWLSRHLWEHYAFSGDREFLRQRAYPLMKGAAEFCLDWLIADQSGNLVTNPSTSPENAYLTPDGQKCNVSYGSTMDMAIIRDLFMHCIACCQLLGIDAAFRARIETALPRLLPFQIGIQGQLQEWAEDFADFEPGHRHQSHLFGLYPGDQISPAASPELAQACRKTIEMRLENGGGQTGWSLAWLINLYARLGDGEAARRCVRNLLANSVYPNLFDLHPPLSPKEAIVFQIDGNFGATAGIAEMLLQSRIDELVLLPALPREWSCGEVRGLRGRGGYTVDLAWQEGKMTEVAIRPDQNGDCQVSYGSYSRLISVTAGKTYRFNHKLMPTSR